jgi:hypothetical protein
MLTDGPLSYLCFCWPGEMVTSFHRFTFVAALAAIVLVMWFGVNAPKLNAQVTVQGGPAPVCPYGYYDYAPYPCAPYGYYGPEWFTNGVFIGVGPWFHGPENFHGHVDNHYDVHHGYKGPLPNRGEKPEESKRPERQQNFKGNESRDGRGHTVEEKR